MTPSPRQEQLVAPTNDHVFDFEPSKIMGSRTLQQALEELSFEGSEDGTQCTAAESDDSSQAGINFVHLKLKKSVEVSTQILDEQLSENSSPILKETENLPAPELVTVRQQSEKILDSTPLDSTSATTTSTPTAPPTTRRPKVTFHEVELRFYDQTIGDHPNTSYGPPITLDWAYQEAEAIQIDEYELHRGPRRNMRQMVLSYYARKNTLMWCYNHTEAELKKATRATKKAAMQRGITNYFHRVSKVEELVTSAGRKAKRAMKKSRKSN